MNSNFIKNIHAQIDQILADRDREQADLTAKLKDVQAMLAEARNGLKKAAETTNVKAYQEAKEAEFEALNAEEMYTTRIKQLKGSRIVSEEEDAKVVAEIRAYQRKLEEAAVAKVTALLCEAEQVGREYWAAQDAADKALYRWHQKVCKQIKRESNKPCETIEDIRYRDGELRNCIRQLATMYSYRKLIGSDEYHGSGSFWN